MGFYTIPTSGPFVGCFCLPIDIQNTGLPAKATENAVTPATIQEAIVDAAGEINSALTHNTQPIVSCDGDLIQCNVDLASEIIIKTRGFNPTAQLDKDIRETAAMRRKWLDLVSRGERFPSNIVDSAPGGMPAAPNFVSQPPQGWNAIL